MAQTLINTGVCGFVDNVDNFYFQVHIMSLKESQKPDFTYKQKINKKIMLTKNIHSFECRLNRLKLWIMWISYFPNRFSPILTTSPAPIVINRSLGIQFCNKNISMSPNEEK